MHVVVDTNVPIVANGHSEQASPACVATCARLIREIQQQHVLVLDDNRAIIKEYMRKLRSERQPGAGDAFLKWVLTNQANPQRCTKVTITLRAEPAHDGDYQEFPDDPDLMQFDRSDRKFVAVVLAHPEQPPIYNAVDSDWLIFRDALARHGVRVEFICEDDLRRLAQRGG